MSIIIFIIILGILVLVHEFGHFLAAKKNGVLVEEFGFGFPPRLAGKKIGETLYSFNLFPIGGFVKLFGEEYHELEPPRLRRSEETGEPRRLINRAFAFKKPWQKALIIVAGVLMNLLLAIFLYYITLSLNNFKSEPMPLLNNYNFRFGSQENKVIIGSVIPNSPASRTDIEVSDIASRVGTEAQPGQILWKTISDPEEFIKIVKNSQDKLIFLDLENIINGEKKVISVIPLYDKKLKRALIGINLVDAALISYDSPSDRILSGILHSYNVTAYNIEGIRFLFSQAAKDKSLTPLAEGSAGPVGIFRIVDDLVQSSGKKLILNLLNLLALLSTSLAIINILPFAALDGGRFAFVVYEWITKKRVNQTFERNLNLVGFALLLTLAGLVTINDIIKIYR